MRCAERRCGCKSGLIFRSLDFHDEPKVLHQVSAGTVRKKTVSRRLTPWLSARCSTTDILNAFDRAQRDTVLPLSSPLTGTDGSAVMSVPVPKGTVIIIGIYSANRNKVIWGEDAEEWKPERWLDGKMPQTVLEAKMPGVYSNL